MENTDFQCYVCMERKPRGAGKAMGLRQPKICNQCHDIMMANGQGIAMVILNLADDIQEYLDRNRPNPMGFSEN